MSLSENEIKSLLQFRALNRFMEDDSNRDIFLQKLLNATLAALDSRWGYIWSAGNGRILYSGTKPANVPEADLRKQSADLLKDSSGFQIGLLRYEPQYMTAVIWHDQQVDALINVFDKQAGIANGGFTEDDQTLFAVLAATGSMGLAKIAVTEENARLLGGETDDPLQNLIRGHSPGVRHLRQQIRAVVDFKCPVSVLIQGESGTGKELVAEAIRRFGPYSSGAYKAVNCAVLSKDMLQSELFGHVRGAFTGATTDKEGLLEVVNDGVLFLDEIGEMSIELQPMLLRVLEDGSFRRLGGTEDLHSNFQLVCATNRDLEKEVSEGKFREDLFYRLDEMVIEVPPLRERKEDIAELVDYFVQKFNARFAMNYTGFTRRALHQLEQYSWPGNIRELQSVVRKGMMYAGGKRLIDLPDMSLKNDQTQQDVLIFHKPIPLKQAVASYVRYSYNRLDRHVTRTMETLDIDYRQLMRHLGKRLDAHLEVQLKSGIELELADNVEEILQNVELEEAGLRGLKRAIIEAVLNALEHSNSADGRLKVHVEVTARRVKVRVCDFGTGFQPDDLPDIDPEVKIYSRETRGWGILMMKKSVDELKIDSDSEGTTVTMTINR